MIFVKQITQLIGMTVAFSSETTLGIVNTRRPSSNLATIWLASQF